MKKTAISRMKTGVRNLDDILGGGLPEGSVSVVGGPPGSGKTIFAHQICFHNASAKRRALYFNTLSEPVAKALRHLSQFRYFDAKMLDDAIRFVDLGIILRAKGLEEAQGLIMQHLKKVKPAIVIVDSFKMFDDLAKSQEERRKFSYEMAVNFMAWETTALLLGEYGPEDYETNPLFSIVDGLMTLSQRDAEGERQRFFQVTKMRGTDHSRDEHSFSISSDGIEIYAPRVTIQRKPGEDKPGVVPRCKTGISKLDDLLGEGIPRGSSLLIAGVAGTGKTVLLLEFLYRGALAGEKGIVFSFEETEERLRATARGLGWNLDHEIKQGMVEIVFIPQPNIQVEKHLLMMQERVEAIGARRVAIDSVSVFLHRVTDRQASREKIFQLCSIVQNVQGVGFFATDIPYGSNQVSRFGVEETVVDGVILLSSVEEGLERERYVEIYKLRNTAHLKGRHNLMIGEGGISVFPRYVGDASLEEKAPPSVDVTQRLQSGTPGFDELIGGGFLKRSMTLLSGSAGIGKSTFSTQFLLEGAKRKEPGIYVTLEEGKDQILNSADALGLPLSKVVKQGLIEIVYLSRERVRGAQFLTVLADKVQERKVQRLVLDGVSNILGGSSLGTDELRQLLYKLTARFKALGVTSIFTLESKSMFSTDAVTDREFSPIADNLVMFRYLATERKLEPTVIVVKTRGSEHDWHTCSLKIGKGGMRIGRSFGESPEKAHAVAKKSRST
jgi:circadian clock protein KaiC